MKALSNIGRIQTRQETLMLLLELYEFKGKIFYYDDLFKDDLNAILSNTLESDVIAISEILKLDLTNARINYISKKDFKPKNKDEILIYNYKKVINLLHTNYQRFELLVNEVEELSKRLYNNHSKISFKKETSLDEGLLKSNSKRVVKDELQKLIDLYYQTRRENNYERLVVITNFYVDFINMNFFDSYNEEIGLILLYSLIIVEFPIFKYVSFFKHLKKHISDFNHALAQASYNWASKFSQTDNLNEIIYQILKISFKEVDDFAYEYSFQLALNKSDSVENSILKFNKQFTKEDIRELHPTISDSTIERTLKRLRDEKKIMAVGTGRGAKWQIIVDNKDYRAISMFDDE